MTQHTVARAPATGRCGAFRCCSEALRWPRPTGRRGGSWRGSGRRGGGNRLPTRKCEFGFWRRGLTSRYVRSTDLRAVARPSRGCPARRRRDERPASQAHDAGDGRRLREHTQCGWSDRVCHTRGHEPTSNSGGSKAHPAVGSAQRQRRCQTRCAAPPLGPPPGWRGYPHGGRETPPSARRVVPDVPGDALVDRAASSEGLAVPRAIRPCISRPRLSVGKGRGRTRTPCVRHRSRCSGGVARPGRA